MLSLVNNSAYRAKLKWSVKEFLYSKREEKNKHQNGERRKHAAPNVSESF